MNTIHAQGEVKLFIVSECHPQQNKVVLSFVYKVKMVTFVSSQQFSVIFTRVSGRLGSATNILDFTMAIMIYVQNNTFI